MILLQCLSAKDFNQLTFFGDGQDRHSFSLISSVRVMQTNNHTEHIFSQNNVIG